MFRVCRRERVDELAAVPGKANAPDGQRSCVVPAKQVNPKVKVILKYPQWYDGFQDRGYIVDRETELFDKVWVGTELRDPNLDEWGHKQQYERLLHLPLAQGRRGGEGWRRLVRPIRDQRCDLPGPGARHGSRRRSGSVPFSLWLFGVVRVQGAG